jgi:alginate O-acetyltransferase complex protein AlgI
MLVSGFWHGAAWNFVIWGGLHAASTSLERLTHWPEKVKSLPGGRFLASFIILVQVWVTWVFFRAATFDQAMSILKSMFSFQGGVPGLVAELGGIKILTLMVIISIAALREFWFFMKWDQREFFPPRIRAHVEVLTMAALIVVCVFFRGPGSQFIYFQF